MAGLDYHSRLVEIFEGSVSVAVVAYGPRRFTKLCLTMQEALGFIEYEEEQLRLEDRERTEFGRPVHSSVQGRLIRSNEVDSTAVYYIENDVGPYFLAFEGRGFLVSKTTELDVARTACYSFRIEDIPPHLRSADEKRELGPSRG